MPDRSCPYCGRFISRTARHCHHCDLVLPSRWELLLARGGKRGIVITFGLPMLLLLVLLIWPAMQRPKQSGVGNICKKNLKQIALALHNYHDEWHSFPPAFIADKDGKPMHSWRVLILPYLGETDLYASYDFSKPWDAPDNQLVLERMPKLFRCHSDQSAPPYTTNYAAVFGAGCLFDPERPIRIRDVKDGTTTTLMVGEVVDVNIPWTKPEDIDVSQHPGINQPGGFGSRHEGGCQFALADGSVKFIEQKLSPELCYALFHRNDGKQFEGACVVYQPK
ncbi:MAG: DUF1559 domain-containing protein [Planctomycetaceae bacterium]